MSKKYHPYHLVDNSPWPYILSNGILTLLIGITLFMHYSIIKILFIGAAIVITTLVLWFRDIVRESVYNGLHTKQVTLGLKIGMLLFIVSEVLFFFSFFWAFFNSSLSPNIELSCSWPPFDIDVLNLLHHPLVNTFFLLFSATTVTVCHHRIVEGDKYLATESLIATLIFGFWFIYTQYIEYSSSSFCFADSVYGSTFFITTGFHGLHVIIGMIFLSITLFRLLDYQFSTNHHFGFEASVWYWHFVDVVWLFLFICIYWWGS